MRVGDEEYTYITNLLQGQFACQLQELAVLILQLLDALEVHQVLADHVVRSVQVGHASHRMGPPYAHRDNTIQAKQSKKIGVGIGGVIEDEYGRRLEKFLRKTCFREIDRVRNS